MFELLDLYYYHDQPYFLYADSSSLRLGDRFLDNILFSMMIQDKKKSKSQDGKIQASMWVLKVITNFQVKQSLPPRDGLVVTIRGDLSVCPREKKSTKQGTGRWWPGTRLGGSGWVGCGEVKAPPRGTSFLVFLFFEKINITFLMSLRFLLLLS
jgi:hypothetical protein